MCREILGNERGYSLVESLFHLLLFCLFTQLVYWFFIWQGAIEETVIDQPEDIEWELFIADLQRSLQGVERVSVYFGNAGINYKKGTEEIDIHMRDTVLRKQKHHEGHIPLLYHVRSIHFTFNGTTLEVRARLLNGKVKERKIAIELLKE